MSGRVVLTPLSGRVVPLADVPDPVFSEGMMGVGVAVDPDTDVAVAPAAGELVVLHSSGHAFALRTPEGLEVLVHLGLDTVKLKGRGFTPLRARGTVLEAGEAVVRFDRLAIQRAGYSVLSPVVFPSVPQGYRIRLTTAPALRMGEVLARVEAA